MPAKNPRLTITLQPSLAAQLRKLSELTGNSQSALIGDLLQGSGPVFDRMIHVLEAAKTARESMKGRLVGDMDAAQTKLEGLLGVALDEFDRFTLPLLDDAEAVSRRARSVRKGAPLAGKGTARAGRDVATPTPLSNRGVRYDPEATKVIAQSHPKVSEKLKKQGAKNRGGNQ